MKVRVRVAIYGLLALALWQAAIMYRQGLVIERQRTLIRQLVRTT